jgi:hypothetical protein
MILVDEANVEASTRLCRYDAILTIDELYI